ncbi:TPA: hypothetical protein U2D09_000415 [Streptococcus suis]|nr:hypothetical protein [Streptococcus suis]HEM6302249.1 hypothetical protein [Streptococcus suis]
MTYNINNQLKIFKQLIENSIIERGEKGKESMIRSSQPINLIHDATKYELINQGIDEKNIFPPLGETKPELKLAGFLKQKKQDICVVPNSVQKIPTIVNWGPLAFNKKTDEYGFEFSEQTLIINVRSQMSSLNKNSDTLFERTYAEALNLHMRYQKAVLGEVYLIPTHEYDDSSVKNNIVAFKDKQTDLEKYISFFNSISGRSENGNDYSYERCALLIVDFNREQPHLYSSTDELKADKLVSDDFEIEYSNINFQNFAKDILSIYSTRFNLDNLK